MGTKAWVEKSESPEDAVRRAVVRSYMSAKTRLYNAQKAMNDAVQEVESALEEMEQASKRLDVEVLGAQEKAGG